MDIDSQHIFAIDGWTCVYCGKRLKSPQIDHIVPVSRGGTDVVGNLATSCMLCNIRKNNRLIDRSILPRRFQGEIDQTPVRHRKPGGSRGNRKAINARYYQRHKPSRRAYMKLWMRERRKNNQQTNHEI